MYTHKLHLQFIISLLLALLLMLIAGCASKGQILQMTASYEQYEKLVEADTGKSTHIKTSQLFPLCEAYAKLKRYNKLFPCLSRLDDNFNKGDKSTNDWSANTYLRSDVTPFVSMMRAEAYIELGDYTKAIEEAKNGYEKTLKGSFPAWDETLLKIKTYNMLSMAYAFSGNRKEAEKYRDLLVDLYIPFGGSALNNQEKQIALAKVHICLGEYDKALKYLKQSPGVMASIGFGLIGSMIGAKIIYFELPNKFVFNKCLYETGSVQKAKEGYDALLQTPQTRENGEIYWMILFDRGRIAEKEGNLKEAIGFYSRAVDIIEQQRSTINTEANKIGFVGDKQAVYHNLVSALFADKQYDKAFEYVERSKARALVDLLASKKDFAIRAGDDRVVKALLARNDTAEAENLIQDASLDKSKTRSVSIKIREELQKESPELASLVSVTSLAATEIQSNIPKDEVLIEYYYAEKDMFAFVLSDRGLKAVRLNGDKLADDIQQFRKLLESPGSSDYMELSRQLFNRLIQPLENSLGNHNLIIVPHGALHYLPFNALHNGKSYLIERYSIRILPSASVIKYLQAKKTSKPADILVFGNPDLGDPRYDLVYAQNEAIAVSKTQSRSRVLLRKEATETAFKKYGSSFKYIHFATHGQFNVDAPLKSAVLLAPDAESDGILTVNKLYSTKIDADLVTLSACETGLGKIANGDDIVGLTRGFLYAGSSSIVASLWKVDDLATADLMTRFYTNMKTLDKREALRQAQLQTKKKYDHPFYWASFQLTGNSK